MDIKIIFATLAAIVTWRLVSSGLSPQKRSWLLFWNKIPDTGRLDCWAIDVSVIGGHSLVVKK
jgi:hypothetical protein